MVWKNNKIEKIVIYIIIIYDYIIVIVAEKSSLLCEIPIISFKEK